MGHKTHPLGFRLGIVQEDKSLWYSAKKRIYIEIQSVVPGRIVGKSGAFLRKLDEELSALLKNKKVLINIVEITKPYTEATILVDLLVKKLEERVSFRMCIREILKRYRTEDESRRACPSSNFTC